MHNTSFMLNHLNNFNISSKITSLTSGSLSAQFIRPIFQFMLSVPLSKNDLALLKLPALKVEKFWTLLAKLAAKIENPYTRSKRFSLNIKAWCTPPQLAY